MPAKRPTILGIHGKIAVLERRRDHLARRLEKTEYNPSHAADFDRAEVDALEAAITALNYVA